MPEEKYIRQTRDKSYRDVNVEIHDEFLGYCNKNELHTGETLSKAMKEYMKKHPTKK